MLLEEVTTEDAEEAFQSGKVAVLPIGSIEQHGPALPLCTDIITAETVARGVSDRSDTVVLPTIPVGVSPHHIQFYGTLSVSDDTLKRYIEDVLKSVIEHGIEKFIIINGHGGNMNAIESVAQEFYRAESAFVIPWNWWDGISTPPTELFDDDVKIPGHAGAVEGSMIANISPQLIDESKLNKAVETKGDRSRFDHPDFRGFDLADFTDNGVHGDPRRTSAEAGKILCEESIMSLENLIDWLVDLPDEKCVPLPHK
ncbi:creatininase family protein [Natrialba sp. INN-245]|uniref:creatininase family protein n=1 Tax=Natrialba sp. INN-245 TaxID=2690967 RepID=UPI0013120B23|nr:creatininase family protein [Natrialba sp. INN-245]MWV39787.1 creatininase family protein [Natrialba sp. INN-245]